MKGKAHGGSNGGDIFLGIFALAFGLAFVISLILAILFGPKESNTKKDREKDEITTRVECLTRSNVEVE